MTQPEKLPPVEGDEPAPRLDDQLCFALHAASHAFHRAYKPVLDALHLTYPQYLVMLLLWQHGTMGVKALGEKLFLDSGTLSPLLKRLEQAGHVIRQRDPGDERQVKVSLSDTGDAMRGQAAGIMATMVSKTGCSIPQAEALRDQLKALRQRLEG
nr:MarR family transcriptional regulator [uncultured Gellertiella sp.]